MRTRSIAKLAGLGLIILAAASCNKEQGSYRGIRFQAKSYGYLGVPGAADTKTTYTGQMTGTTERIEWTNGDLIRIVSDKAYMLDDENVHQCDFCVDGHTEEGAVSSASIDPVDAANALQWRTGKHHFWAMYPSSATAGVPAGTALSSTGTMTFAIPATQVVTKKDGEMTWLPNMKQAPMLAHKVTTPSASVPLEFTPQFTAFEFTVSKGSLPGVTLTGFRLIRMDDTGFTGTLAGTYTIAFDGENGVYESTPTVTGGASTEIAIDWSATDNRIVLDADHPEFTFTVFALPETLKGLKIEFTGRFSNTGEDFTQTRSLRLRSAAGEALNFLPFLKYKIYGLSFPEMVDATIEDSINWDHSVLVMDNVVWWMNAGLDYTEWVVEDTGSRYAYLQDKLAWWIPSGVADDIAWEEIKDIQLSSTADAYLWRHQSVTRTAYLRNYSNQTYSDVTVAWSAEQEGNAVHVNEHTGEVTALRPGEATVIATVTPNNGSDPWTASYKVYVNAPTAIALAAAANPIAPSGSTTLTATVTCTSNGTIPSLPDDLLVWTSATTAAVTLAGAQTQPALATGEATATANGVAAGTSVITVSVNTKYADNVSNTLTLTVE